VVKEDSPTINMLKVTWLCIFSSVLTGCIVAFVLIARFDASGMNYMREDINNSQEDVYELQDQSHYHWWKRKQDNRIGLNDSVEMEEKLLAIGGVIE